MSALVRRCAAAALVAAGVLAGCAPSPAPSLPPGAGHDGLRVMTWNVLGVQADANVYDEHAGWAARIDQLQPDVLVVQEAQSDDVSALLQRTAGDYTLATFIEWDCDVKPQREGVAVLVRSSVRLLSAGGSHVGESCLDPTVSRILVWADLDLDGGPVRVYGTHLTAGGAASEDSRNAQIRSIKELIVEHDPADERRWVLAGDLNLAPRNFSYRLMTGAVPEEPGPYPFVDTYAVVSPDSGDPTTCPSRAATDTAWQEVLLADPDLVRRCGYTGGWAQDTDWIQCHLLSLCTSWETRRDTSVRTRIDHVMVPGGGPIGVLDGFVPNRSDADWAAPGAEWFRLSDHLPYVADLSVG